jgi:hypothetical protein
MVGLSRRCRNGNENLNTLIIRNSLGQNGSAEDSISMELSMSIDGRRAREFRADVYLYGRAAKEALRVAFSMLDKASERYLSPGDREVLEDRMAEAREAIEGGNLDSGFEYSWAPKDIRTSY